MNYLCRLRSGEENLNEMGKTNRDIEMVGYEYIRCVDLTKRRS